MRLSLVVAASLAVVAALPRHVRNARYAALPTDMNDKNFELVFSHALWRHGDRSSEHEVPGRDLFTEDDWTFGGGGYGELSPEGMSMHFNLGRKLRARYMDTFNILSSAYNSREIYIRATDYNRTLISAYANVAGMYTNYGVEGQNYPEKTLVADWPAGYIPIPIHTVERDFDHAGRPDAKCARQDELYEMVKNSAEYQSYINDPQVAYILKYLSDETGTDVNIDNIYDLNDPIFCEMNHIEELNATGANIADFYPWYYTGNVSSFAEWIVDKDQEFTDGMGNPGGINGVDISVEIPKIRAGDTLKLVVDNVRGVLRCRDNMDDDSCRSFYKKLKYYALSAHDTTLASFLTILGVKKYIIPEGYPNYSAAVLIEVYEDKDTAERYFKVLYHADKNDDFKSITAFVRGCDPKENYCAISVLDDLVSKYAHDGTVEELCAIPVDQNPVVSSSTVKTTTGSSTTTTKPTTTTTTPTTTTSGISTVSIISACAVILMSFLF